MLKSLIVLIMSLMTFSAYAQNVQYNVCVNTLEKEYLASTKEAATVCNQNSKPEFMQCMVYHARHSTIHVLEAAPKCSNFKVNIPVESKDPTYFNAKSCPAKLQIRTKMSDVRARQICAWDSSELMQNCILDLAEKARFHSEHAIQYCGFANAEYRNKIPTFVACVIENSRRGFGVYANVMNCDNRIAGKPIIIVQPNPNPGKKPEPTYEEPPITTQPEVIVPPVQPQEVPPTVVTTVPPAKTGGRVVPTPVEIQMEGSSQPEVTGDAPVETGTTTNSESLPL